MIVADACVIIAALNPGESHHTWAVETLSLCASVVVHRLTLAEVLVVAARQNPGQAHALHQSLLDLGVSDHKATDVSALDLAQARAQSGLKMPDACVLATALHLDLSLSTLDTKLMAAATQAGVKVVSPSGICP